MRIDVIDVIKGIAIIMIVNVHLLSGQFFLIGSTYHVIAFFFSCGLVHGITEKWQHTSFAVFAKSRLKQLGHPYLVLSLCYILMHMILNVLRGDIIINAVISDSFIKTIVLRGIGTLWFFPVLFFGEILFYGAKKRNTNSLIIVLIGAITVFISSALNNYGVFNALDRISVLSVSLSLPLKILMTSVIAAGTISLGHWICRYIIGIFKDSYFRSNKRFICLVAFCAISYFIDLSLMEYYQGDLHKLDIINPVIYIICSLAGLSFVTSLALIIKRVSTWLTNLMTFLGRNSLIIMTTHTEYYINSIANILIVSLLSISGISASPKIISGLALIMILLIEVGIVFIVNHTFLKRVFIAK